MTGLVDALAGRARVEDVCAADVHYEDPLTPSPCHGVDQLRAHLARARRAFPDLDVVAVDTLVDGARHVVAVRATGTHGGEVDELPATGLPCAVVGVLWLALDDEGRVHRARAFFDVYDAGAQLGVLPRPGSLGAKALRALQGFGLRA